MEDRGEKLRVVIASKPLPGQNKHLWRHTSGVLTTQSLESGPFCQAGAVYLGWPEELLQCLYKQDPIKASSGCASGLFLDVRSIEVEPRIIRINEI